MNVKDHRSLSTGVSVELLLQVPLVLVYAILNEGGVHLGVINENQIGREERAAHHVQVVRESLLFVRIFPVHKLADRELQYFLHVSLLEEFLEHGLHPLEEYGGSSDHLECVGRPQGHAHYECAVLHRIRREIIPQLRLELSEEHEVFAQVCIQHALYNHLAHLSLSLDGDVLEQVHVLHLKHYLKCSGQMMMLEDLDIRIPNGEGMLGPDYKLIGIAGVLIIMDQIREEGGKHILEL